MPRFECVVQLPPGRGGKVGWNDAVPEAGAPVRSAYGFRNDAVPEADVPRLGNGGKDDAEADITATIEHAVAVAVCRTTEPWIIQPGTATGHAE
jgi:hypothetical protein